METEPRSLLCYLHDHGYPLPWSLEALQTRCVILRVDRGLDTIAYLWASWIEHGVLDFHACSSRRLWLTPELLDRLYFAAELFGADAIQTTPQGDHAPLMRRLLHNAGFERNGAAMLKRIGPPLGNILGTEGAGRPADSGAAAAT